MPTPQIKKIRHLKKVGLLSDIAVGQWPLKMARYNLIYGFNGAGKTTISRMMGSLAKAEISKHLSKDTEFSFEFDDGTTYSPSSITPQICRLIGVFNEDFIDDCLVWRDATANPIVYLGKDQAAEILQLEKLGKKLEALRPEQILKSSEWANAEKAKNTFCTNHARLISEEVSLGRSYNAANFRTEVSDDTLCTDDKLTDDERLPLKEIILKSNPPVAMEKLFFSEECQEARSNTEATLRTTIADLSIEELDRRPDATGWVETGLTLHEFEESCLFCGNTLQASRMSTIREVLSGSFADLKSEIAKGSMSVKNFKESCFTLETECRSLKEPSPQFRVGFELARSSLLKMLNEARNQAQEWEQKLQSKLENLDIVVESKDLITWDWDKTLAYELSKLNGFIEQHNDAVANFKNEQQSAKNRLKRHFLFDGKSAFDEHVAKDDGAKEANRTVQKEIDDIEVDVIRLRTALSAHGLATDRLNSLIHSYLGHSKISLEADDIGYQICRNGSPSKKPLSEGEKTAVAFCYFIASLTSEGKKIEDLIVIIDDPVSSLDAKSMLHVVSLIKREIANVAQMFVLTHNLDFMSEMRKWLRPKREKGDATFLFVEAQHFEDAQKSKIIEMPKLIREYESEYHYLFSLVKSLAEAPNDHEGFAYLMPNAIRKVLEIFLAFKVPGSSGLSSKIQKLLSDDQTLDGNRITAMERLAMLESHAESIGDTTTFSAYTLNEISDAAKCLLELVERSDPTHYSAMNRLCTRAAA